VPRGDQDGRARAGGLNLYSRRSRALVDDLDQSTFVLLAEQAAVALATALALDGQRRAALTLPTQLLPRDTPAVPGYELAASYQPASATADIGGDWYDAYRLHGTGPLAATIGDVDGHSIEAASVMVQIRTALRAYTAEGHSPSAALELTDGLMMLSAPQRDSLSATACLVLLDPDSGTCHLASAGHVPAAVRQPDGSVEFVTAHGGAALGVDARGTLGEELFSLEPGSTLVLFTDGLVETRGRSLEEGFERLAVALSAASESADDICEYLIREMQRGRLQEDDVAVLVIRRLPTGLDRP
jgi:serine phosphatase RsbU (regulator of sigma subunit)